MSPAKAIVLENINKISDDLDAAGIAADELRQQIKSLRKNPEKGMVIPEIGNEHFREINYKKCNIVYEIKETMLLVHEIYESPCIFNHSLNKLACTELCEKETFAETD